MEKFLNTHPISTLARFEMNWKRTFSVNVRNPQIWPIFSPPWRPLYGRKLTNAMSPTVIGGGDNYKDMLQPENFNSEGVYSHHHVHFETKGAVRVPPNEWGWQHQENCNAALEQFSIYPGILINFIWSVSKKKKIQNFGSWASEKFWMYMLSPAKWINIA